MSRVICIMGESGSGKTTACRTLDPASTYYIDADRKGLSWQGWKRQYSSEARNYKQTSDAAKILKIMRGISAESPHISTIVIDTLNAVMIDDEMARMKEKGYDKWTDLACSVWGIVSDVHLLRDGLTVLMLAHSQTERDDSGFQFTRIKTGGKKLEKMVLESKMTTVLLAKCVDGRHVLETRARSSTAKTPMGCFAENTIDNDAAKVIEALAKYEEGEE